MTRPQKVKAAKVDITRSSAAYQQVVDSLAAAKVSRITARISFIDSHAVRAGASTKGQIVLIGSATVRMPGYSGKAIRLLVNRRNYEIAGVSQAGEEVGRQGLRIADLVHDLALELRRGGAGPDVRTIERCLLKEGAADIRRLQDAIDAYLVDPATIAAAVSADAAKRAASKAKIAANAIHHLRTVFIPAMIAHGITRASWLEWYDEGICQAVLSE